MNIEKRRVLFEKSNKKRYIVYIDITPGFEEVFYFSSEEDAIECAMDIDDGNQSIIIDNVDGNILLKFHLFKTK